MNYKKLLTKKLWCKKCRKLTEHMHTDMGYECRNCKDKLNQKNIEKNKKVMKALKIMSFMLLVALVTGGVWLAFSNFLYVMGYDISTLSCASHSMWPELQCNDILIYKMFNTPPYKQNIISLPNDRILNLSIQNNSIVWVNYYGVEYVHRVIGRCKIQTEFYINYRYINLEYDGIITMGDNNTASDGCIPLWAIKGELIWHS